MPCVILDPQGTRVHTGELGGSFDFKARVPNWQLGARIQIWLNLEGKNKLQAGDSQSATCEEWCNPKQERVAGAEDHCSWCKCAGCRGCMGSSGLRLGQSCTVPGQITSCWGAKIIEHEWLGQATVRLGPPTSDKDFGCNVALPQASSSSDSTSSCHHLLLACYLLLTACYLPLTTCCCCWLRVSSTGRPR